VALERDSNYKSLSKLKITAIMSFKVKDFCLKISLLICFLQLFQGGYAQYDFSSVDNFLKANQKALGNNLVVMVYKDGKVVYKKELGDFDAKTQAPIASCSKWLTAALVMTFVDEGKMKLDDRIDKYIPFFDSYMKGYITIRNCLSHTTGVEADKPGLMGFMSRKKYETLEEEVNSFASKRQIIANPGKDFAYSMVGLNTAGRAVEVASKKTFQKMMLDRILKPCGMRATNFDADNAPNPSGGAVSTATDYLNFLAMILNKGMFNGKRILSEQAIEEMQKSQTKDLPVRYTPKVAEGFEYGLGEWIQEKDASGNSTVVSSPGLFGTWPYVDKKNNYAAILFVKSLITVDKRDLYLDLKKNIDAALGVR